MHVIDIKTKYKRTIYIGFYIQTLLWGKSNQFQFYKEKNIEKFSITNLEYLYIYEDEK